MTKIEEILAAKTAAGEHAYLWLQEDAGDCILWPNEKSSRNDDGKAAIERWTLTKQEAAELIESGRIDDQN